MGGENQGRDYATPRLMGSSPRGRGKRALDLPVEIGNRLIPAWAGKTPGLRRPPPGHRAHPRVGGENCRRTLVRRWTADSSPRGRGKPLSRRTARAVRRLIPAWAGKTPRRSSSTFSSWAHPRVGGENGLDARRWPWDQGSSPRGRGKPAWLLRSLRAWRLIPAWAGKTTATPLPGFGARAHPRVGGEN